MIINCRIRGLTALMMNKMTDEASLNATAATRGASAAPERKTPEEDARSRLHVDSEGHPVMPATNLLRCLVWGGKSFKIGQSKVTTRDHSIIPGCVTLGEPHYLIYSEGGWHVNATVVTIPATNGKIIRYRPMFLDWEIAFDLELDTDEMSVGLLREIVDKSGKMSGLGDYRPSAGAGPYGKFVVDAWEIIEDDREPEIELRSVERPTGRAARKQRGRPRKQVVPQEESEDEYEDEEEDVA